MSEETTNETTEAPNTEIDDLRAEIERLKAHNEKVIQEKRDTQRKLSEFDGVDLEKYNAMRQKAESDAEKRALAEGNIEEFANLRFGQKENDYKSEIASLKEALETERASISEYKRKNEQQAIQSAVKDAAAKNGVIPQALDDVINRAQGLFNLDESGKIVARDGNGELMMRDGRAYDMNDFIDGLKESAPHYWGASNGAGLNGASGGKGAAGLEARMQAAAAQGNMTEYKRLRAERKKAMAR